LATIYDLLDTLEPVEKDEQYFRPQKELYPWPLAIAFGFALVIAVLELNPDIVHFGSSKMNVSIIDSATSN